MSYETMFKFAFLFVIAVACLTGCGKIIRVRDIATVNGADATHVWFVIYEGNGNDIIVFCDSKSPPNMDMCRKERLGTGGASVRSARLPPAPLYRIPSQKEKESLRQYFDE